MKSAARRAGKYGAKVRGLVLPGQALRFGGAAPGQVHIETGVKVILERSGVMPALHHFYMVFGKELGKLMGKHSGQTMMDEVEGLQVKWGGRGLDVAVMDLIKEWFGIRLPPAPPAGCLFDVGLFDVCLFG